jgi:hypothetical protein
MLRDARAYFGADPMLLSARHSGHATTAVFRMKGFIKREIRRLRIGKVRFIEPSVIHRVQRFHRAQPYPANSLIASASTSAPCAIASGEEYSSGRWLTPCLHGMNNMAVGAIRDMNSESW